jgi:hypothetical protein
MAPLLAGLAVLLFLLFLGRGFAFADVKRLAKSLRSTAGIVLGLAAVGLLVAGRVAFAFLAAGASWALLMGRPPPWQRSSAGGGAGERPRATTGKMSRAEALKVLGLDEGANEEQIRAAHRRLILQTHPDRGGSNYLAAKINEAKDVLVGR